MTLYSPKRSVRKVVDAGYDLSSNSTENVDSSEQIGFTTKLIQNHLLIFPSSTALTTYQAACQIFEDNYGNIPAQNGAQLVGISPGVTGCTGFIMMTDVGLKHHHQELQAIKGFQLAGINLGNTTVGTPAHTAITDVYDGSGTYKTTNISLGDMRGFRYSEDNSTSNWPSTGNPTQGIGERIRPTGAVSIGSAV